MAQVIRAFGGGGGGVVGKLVVWHKSRSLQFLKIS